MNADNISPAVKQFLAARKSRQLVRQSTTVLTDDERVLLETYRSMDKPDKDKTLLTVLGYKMWRVFVPRS
jgi:hypothetical protein